MRRTVVEPFDYNMVDELINTILSIHNPKMIVIFGSVAKGTAKKGSDIDVMVVMETKERPIRRGMDILDALEIPTDVDLIVLTPKEYKEYSTDPYSFTSEIMRTGRIVYGSA